MQSKGIRPKQCPECSREIVAHLTHCQTCYAHVGFPNVRAAELDDELNALATRFDDAIVSTKARNCLQALEEFGDAVVSSEAAISLRLGSLHRWVTGVAPIRITYYKQISSGSRNPEDNQWDHARNIADQFLFPYYAEEINFAALTLDDNGVESYGEYTAILDATTIEKRASVFEENSLLFVKRRELSLTNPLPSGFRTSWSNRRTLAMAKLHSVITHATTRDDFAGILLRQGTPDVDEDFIEVNIYGAVTIQAIKCVVGTVPQNRDDKLLWKQIKAELGKSRVQVKEM